MRLIVLVTLVLAFPARAVAEPVTIYFDGPVWERPAHVCVIHNGTEGSFSRLQLDGTDDGSPSADVLSRNATRVQAQLEEQLESLPAAPSAPPGEPGADAPACLRSVDPPRIRQNEQLYFNCVANAHQANGGRGLVVLFVDFSRSRPIQSMDLQGASAWLSVGGPSRATDVITVTVIGGDYVGGSGTVEGSRVVLTPRARCVQRNIRIPPVVSDERPVAGYRVQLVDGSATEGSPSCWQWDRTLDWNGQVVMPRGAPRQWHVRLFALETRSTDTAATSCATPPANQTLASYETSWAGGEPPPLLEPSATSLTFEWQAGCEYPFTPTPVTVEAAANEALDATALCPEAELPEHGVRCDAVEARRVQPEPAPPPRPDEDDSEGEEQAPPPPMATGLICKYRCPDASAAEPIELPSLVRMTAPELEDHWTERLRNAGQRLRSYAGRSERTFPVSFPEGIATRARRTGDRIDYVRLRTASGDTFVFDPSEADAQRVTIPGGTCGASLMYGYSGQRIYYRETLRIKNGKIDIPDPADSAREWYPSLYLGGGFQRPVCPWADDLCDDLPFDPYGAAAGGLHWRHPDFHIWGTSFAFYLEVSYIIARALYRPQHTDGRADDEALARVAYNRGIVALGASISLPLELETGVDVGLVMGGPLLDVHEPQIEGTRFAASTRHFIRGRLSRAFSVELAVRLLYPQPFFRYSYSDFGDAGRSENDVMLVFLEAGVRYWP